MVWLLPWVSIAQEALWKVSSTEPRISGVAFEPLTRTRPSHRWEITAISFHKCNRQGLYPGKHFSRPWHLSYRVTRDTKPIGTVQPCHPSGFTWGHNPPLHLPLAGLLNLLFPKRIQECPPNLSHPIPHPLPHRRTHSPPTRRMDPQPQRCLTYSTCCLCILGLPSSPLPSPWLSSCPTVEATFVPTGLQPSDPRRDENILSAELKTIVS